ncbi:hypothetical protein SLA2020_529280 [Shorea laevis]
MSNFCGLGNGVQGLSNNLSNMAPYNLGSGFGSQNYGMFQDLTTIVVETGISAQLPSLALGNPCGPST